MIKVWLIYWCAVTSTIHEPAHVASVIDIQEDLITLYIYPYGMTDFEVLDGRYTAGRIWISDDKYYNGIINGTFDLKHPHGFGVMLVSLEKVTLFVYITDGKVEYRDTLVMTRKNWRKTCEFKK